MTAPTIADRTYTPEDLLTMEDGGYYELVEGRLVERAVSMDSSDVASRTNYCLHAHVGPSEMGRIFDSELGIRIFEDASKVRRADLSYLAADRLPAGDAGYLTIPPDLVVEVVSPGDRASEVREKAAEWLGAGVREVWVLYPESREVYVYSATAHPRVLTADDEITGGDVVPGFRCPVASFFPPR